MTETGCEIRSDACTDQDVRWREDPFMAEVHGEQVYAFICKDCYDLLSDEV